MVKYVADILFEYFIQTSVDNWLKKGFLRRKFRNAVKAAYVRTLKDFPWLVDYSKEDFSFLMRYRVAQEIRKFLIPTEEPDLDELAEEWERAFRSEISIYKGGEIRNLLRHLKRNISNELSKINELQVLIGLREIKKSNMMIEGLRHSFSQLEKVIRPRGPFLEDSFLNEKGEWTAYLENLKIEFQHWHIPKELDEFADWPEAPVPIDDYVVLKNKSQRKKKSSTPRADRERNAKEQEILQTLLQAFETSKLNPIIIFGSSGAGKSTCLRYLAYTISNRSLSYIQNPESDKEFGIPIWVSLKRYGPNRLFEIIQSEIANYFEPLNTDQLKSLLSMHTFIFLLDGLDEIGIKWREEAINEISIFQKSHSNCRFVVTTRTQPEPYHIEGFTLYELQPIEDRAVLSFVNHYIEGLHNNVYALLNKWPSDLIRVPLLLTLMLIIYKTDEAIVENYYSLYESITKLYKDSWEKNKLRSRVRCEIPWELVENALADLAFFMINNDALYELDKETVQKSLQKSVKRFSTEHRWPIDCSVTDLLTQILISNHLQLSQGRISFWHASFRDFYASQKILTFSERKVISFANDPEWAAIMVYVCGRFGNPEEIREALVYHVVNEFVYGDWAIKLLALMGKGAYLQILKICELEIDLRTLHSAMDALENLDYEHAALLNSVANSIESLNEEFEDWEYVNLDTVIGLYKEILQSLIGGDIIGAEKSISKFDSYLFEREVESILFLDWFPNTSIQNIEQFHYLLTNNKLEKARLLNFCRNVTQPASIPYLEAILFYSDEKLLKIEAQLALNVNRVT